MSMPKCWRKTWNAAVVASPTPTVGILLEFDHRDARIELLPLDRVLDDEGGDPAGGAAADDNEVGHGPAPGGSTGTTSTFWLVFWVPEALRIPAIGVTS